MTIKSKFFYGTEVSEYGQKNGYVDYATLAKAFDAVMCNDILTATSGTDCGEWEQLTDGRDYDRIDELDEKIDALNEKLFDLYHEDETAEVLQKIKEAEAELEELEEEREEAGYMPEIFQFFIVSDAGAAILREAGEILFYNEKLDLYVWGVTHYGTSWDYVLTSIKIELDD